MAFSGYGRHRGGGDHRRLLEFFTGHIGFHHVHHLNARISHYNLRRAHRENSIFHHVPELSLLDGLRAVHLKLWDQDRGKLVSFADARQPRRGGRHMSDLSGIAEVDL
jgi:fatty acid desaturase